MSVQPDMFATRPVIQPIDRNVGTGNGKALGHIYNGESADQLRARWKAGELKGADPEIIRANLAFRG